MSWRCVQWAPPHCHVPANGVRVRVGERGYPAVQERDRSVEDESCRRRWRRPEMCPLRPHLSVPHPCVPDGTGARIAAEEDDLAPNSVMGLGVYRAAGQDPCPAPASTSSRPRARCRREARSPQRGRRRERTSSRLGRTRSADPCVRPGLCPRSASSSPRPTPRCRPAVSRPPMAPPNRTTRDRFASYASAWPDRATGPVSSTWVQSVPSHSHVSPNATPASVVPPKSTTRPRAPSYARAAPARGCGPTSCFCVQRTGGKGADYRSSRSPWESLHRVIPPRASRSA